MKKYIKNWINKKVKKQLDIRVILEVNIYALGGKCFVFVLLYSPFY